MAKSKMLASIYDEHDGKERLPLIDLGYVDDQATRDRGDALMAFGLRRNAFSIEGFGRLLVQPPKRKLATVLATFPLDEGETYFRTTHHWRGLAEGEEEAPIPQI